MKEQGRDLKTRTKAFALRVIKMYSKLPKSDKVAQVLGKQVLRSGTSVGVNCREASRGRSKAEFISKIGDYLRKLKKPSIGSNCSWTAESFRPHRWPTSSTRPVNSSPSSQPLTRMLKAKG
jgi:hypothetical protein